MERVYLDNNATTLCDPRVRDAMMPFFSQMYGNPNSLHTVGTEVHQHMRVAFDRIYAGLNASDDDDVIINSGATEGNNTVIMSVYYDLIRTGKKETIITTEVEHPSVLAACKFVEELGGKVIYLPVNSEGVVEAATLKSFVNEKTALVSIMWANNETGMIFPIKELASIAKEQGALFHTDGVQTIGKLRINLQDVPVDYMTFSAHKFHGPKGVGGLFIRNGAPMTPLLHGGEQMGGLRSGTVNVPGLVGMGLAMELAVDDLDFELHDVYELKNKLEDAILELPDIFVVGNREHRIPNTILCSVKGVEGEAMIWDLNKKGIAASTGSACASEDLEANPIMVSVGAGPDLAHTAIRFSLSRFTTAEEIDYVIDSFKNSVERLRSISSSYAYTPKHHKSEL